MVEVMRRANRIALLGAGGLLVVLAALEKRSRAEPKPGFWQEAVTNADGVTVRVLRDTTGSRANICYVTSSTGPKWTSVAISCLPDRQP
jgi:hypothetical protein